ncbi:hypothetical protein BST40_14175, partial [Mycobacterium persicum]
MPGCGGGGGSAVTVGDVVDGDAGAVGEVLAWLGPALPVVVDGAPAGEVVGVVGDVDEDVMLGSGVPLAVVGV